MKIIFDDILKHLYKKYMQLRLRNKTFSLISQNCNGMFMLKDLNLPYYSPFVNLWLYPKDFIMFAKNMDYYLNLDMKFDTDNDFEYPVGILGDIKIFFTHFKTKQEALEKWNKRKTRINKSNIFFLMTDRDGCTKEDLIEFDKLPYKNKIVFTHIKYPNIRSAVYIPGFEQDECVGLCFKYPSKHSYKRYQDIFDYVKWFNSINKK